MKEADEILQAIHALETQRAVLGDRVVDAALASLHEKLATLEQYQPVSRQRRLVTVLFLDLVNSTMLSQGLEPEEVQAIVGGTLKRLSGLVEAYNGLVTQFMGDGFVSAFGLQKTHENDARQAIRAGLAMLSETPFCAEDLERRFKIRGFNVRIGINTGRVVAGRFTQAESPVMGLTVTLAARMEQAALPGTLFISQFTYPHVRGAFELELLPPIEAKGFSQPITVYRVLGARPRTFRTFTRGVEGIETRLVGREAELTELKVAFDHSIQSRQIQLVTIAGEAGVGKSRLLYEFDRWVANTPTRVIAFKARASPQTTFVPYSLLREMISYRLGVLITDSVEVTQTCLVQALSEVFDVQAEMKAHFMGALLGFDFSESPYLQVVEHDPKQLSERGQLYLAQYFTAVASQANTIFMLDDIHWADAPSVSFITRFIRENPRLPLLMVCLGRPPLPEGIVGLRQGVSHTIQPPAQPDLSPCSYQINLKPLSHQASTELLGEILRNVEALPEKLSRQILDMADGNPFYLEEYIQTLIDARILRAGHRGDPWKLDLERLVNLELPETLIALLEARLDNLTNAQRALLQQAAVIGQVFWRSALQAVHGEKPVTEEEMQVLFKRGFIFPHEPSTFEGTEEYHFHHALLRDVAYQALLKPDRKSHHGQVASWLVRKTEASGRGGEFTAIIAEHYEQAGELALAADWFIKSGTRARNQGAFAQARTFFDRALVLIDSEGGLSATASDLVRRWEALAGRDEILGVLGDTVARMADDVALVDLANMIGDDHLIAEAYFRRGFYLGMSGQYPQERQAYNLGLLSARRVQDRSREALLLGLLVVCEVRLGDMLAAGRTSIAALACAREVTDDLILARSLTNVSTYYTEMGDMARAAQLLEQQLVIFHRTGNVQDEVVGLSNLGYSYILLGMPEAAIPALRKCIDVSQAIGHRKICAYGGLNLALAYLRHGDSSATLEQLDQYLPELQAMQDTFGHAVGTTYAALAYEQRGNIDEALVKFEQAAATLGEIGTPGNLHDAKAGAARCLLALNNREAAHRSAETLWEYLRDHAGAGMEFPILAYETCADIFLAVGKLPFARRAVSAGYGELLLRAGRISLREWRQSFMERVSEHQRIQERWKKYNESILDREESKNDG